MKRLFSFIILLFLVLIPTRAYWSAGMPYTHDGENHLARFANFKIAIKEGQIPPRFAPNLWNRHGYPVFNYNYPLANIMAMPLVAVFSYQQSFKILVTSLVVLGMIGLWYWLDSYKFNYMAKWLALATWSVHPFLLSTIWYRGNVGEVAAASLLPWIFLFIERVGQRFETKKEIIFWIFLIAAFGLSHNIAVLMAVFFFGGWFVYKYRSNWTVYYRALSIVLLSGGLTLWFWLPAIFEKSQVILDGASLSNQSSQHLLNLEQLLFGWLKFGYSQVGVVDSLGLGVGLISWVGLILGTSLILKYKVSKDDHLAAILAFMSLVMVLQLDLTKSLWNNLPLLNYVQFPWRLSIWLLPLSGWLVAYLWQESKWLIRSILIFCLLVMTFQALNLRVVDRFNRQDVDYDAFSQSTSTAHENLPKTFTFKDIANWKPTAKPLGEDEAHVGVNYWTGSKREYQVTADSSVIMVEPTMYFLGWQTYIDGQQIEYIDSKEIGGRIGYRIDAGTHEVKTVFTQNTPARIVGNSAFGLSLVGVFLFLLTNTKKMKWLIKKK